MISWLPIIILGLALVVGWYSPRTWVWLTALLLPAYVIKFFIGPLPTNLLELILWGGFVGWFFHQPKINLQLLWLHYRSIWWQLLLLVIGLIVGVGIAGDWRLSLGIVKGWFISPILFSGALASILGWTAILEIVPPLVLSTLPISLTALVQVATGQFVTPDGRASAWFESANYLSLYLVPILLLGTITLFEHRGTYSKILFWLAAIPGTLAVYFSYSYGGWLGLAAGLFMLGIWYFRTRWQFWLSTVGIVGLAGVTQISNERVSQMLNLSVQSSASVRLQVWATDWLMTQERWLTGIGLGQYPAQYPQFVARLFPTPLEAGMLHAHNLYFQFIINLGVVGLAGFIGLISYFFLWLKRCSVGCAASLASAMTAILVHGLVDTPYWKNDLAMTFWIILAIAMVNSRPLPTSSSPSL